MATELFRSNMVQLYREVREPDLYLSGLFTAKPGGMSDTEKVVIDVVREDELISPVVRSLEGPTLNVAEQFTTKEFTPPTINEAMPFDVGELMKRQPGVNAFDASDVGFQAQLVGRIVDGMGRLERKMRRNRELQASQILTTGQLSLLDESGAVQYVVDYKPKGTHFTTAGTVWSDVAADIIGDIESTSELIRDDSLQDADELIMGDRTFNAFVRNTAVRDNLDNRRLNVGDISPVQPNSGAKFQGTLHIGNYQYAIVTYNGRGIIPGASVPTKFVPSDFCIVRASSGRMDTVFGGVPRALPVDPRFAGFLPDRGSVPGATDMSLNIYATPNGKQTMLELDSRPLLVPVGIDTFGAIDTGA